ncbi:MAG TPA: D-Ala-D-Ala carboxypeptidase family metallohydrolase [bacterium]|nr:D-Ala-D-Ala carboxypeptidase family metallohydrolase [bacterium]
MTARAFILRSSSTTENGSQRATQSSSCRINDLQVSEHFNLREFQCPCCALVKLDSRLITALESLRANIGGKPIIVTSGYRCSDHNKMLCGAINSDHLHGWAADIVVRGMDAHEIALAAEALPDLIKRIGTYRDRICVHIGVEEREGLPPRWGQTNTTLRSTYVARVFSRGGG